MSQDRYQLWPQMALFAAVISASLIALLLNQLDLPASALIGLHQYPLAESWPLVSALAACLLTGIGLSAWCLYVPGGRDNARHLSGPRLMRGKSAHRHAAKMYRDEAKGNSMRPGIHLHQKIQLSRTQELGNLFVFGQQGSGKGVILKPLIAEIIERKDRVLIYDRKREYAELFADGKTILISPTEANSASWNIAADARTIEDAQLIAERLIPDSPEPIWAEGSRLILTGCIAILNATEARWGWSELASMLVTSEEKLNALLLQHYPEAARFVEENSRTTQGFFATLMSKLSWLGTLGRAWPDTSEQDFSIRQWLTTKGKPTLIVVHDEEHPKLSGSLCNALFSLMSSKVLAMPDSNKRRIWLALDELGNLPRCDSLEPWLSLGRSKGARTLAGTQSISQIKDIYGEHPAETLLNLFSNLICLRLGAAGCSAQFAAQSFGRRDVERPVVSINDQGQRTSTYQSNSEPLIHAEQIVHLPKIRGGIQGFLMVSGWNAVYQLSWLYPDLPSKGPEKQPAAWLTASTKPAPKRRSRRRARAC